MARPNNQPWLDWDFPLRVTTNRVNGIVGVSKYGRNPSIGANTEDIWSNGGILSFLSSAETMNIASTSSDDTSPSGSGARTIEIYGLGENYQPLVEIVTLNGTNNVLTNESFLRINRMRIRAVGDDGVNAGAISATASGSATVQASIPAEVGSTLKSQYTVVEGYHGYIRGITFSTLNNDQVEVTLQTRTEDGPWITRDLLDFVSSTVEATFAVPLIVSPKSDIRIQGARIAGGGTAVISARYEMYLIESRLINSSNVLQDVT